MAMKFENKKLNKDDHAKVDRDAGVARKVLDVIVLLGGLGALGVLIEKGHLKKVNEVMNKVIFKA